MCFLGWKHQQREAAGLKLEAAAAAVAAAEQREEVEAGRFEPPPALFFPLKGAGWGALDGV